MNICAYRLPRPAICTGILDKSYDFTVDRRSAISVALTPGRLKTDTFRVNGPGWGVTYVDCSV